MPQLIPSKLFLKDMEQLSFDPGGYLSAGNPDWTMALILLRILDHDDLYKSPR